MLKRLLLYLWANEDGFFGIGFGPSNEEKSEFNSMVGLQNFDTSQGEAATLAANDFWQSILSGDPGKISQVLGPQMSAINKQGQQEKQTISQFGNRGGGQNAQGQTIDDNTRSSINDLISRLTGSAAGALGASGASLLAGGYEAGSAAFSEANTIQEPHNAKLNDIFRSVGKVAQAVGGAFGPAGQVAGNAANSMLDEGDEDEDSGGGGGGMDFSDFGSMGVGMMGGGGGGGMGA
jgi:hypothetical protein